MSCLFEGASANGSGYPCIDCRYAVEDTDGALWCDRLAFVEFSEAVAP